MALTQAFFARRAVEVARDLVGRTLVRSSNKETETRCVITAVAAYEGGRETAARKGMRYAPGSIFVMPFRGRVFLNIATGSADEASCVCIRAGILEGTPPMLLDGPLKLAQALKISTALDATTLGCELLVEGEGVSPALVCESKPQGTADNCVGVYRLRA